MNEQKRRRILGPELRQMQPQVTDVDVAVPDSGKLRHGGQLCRESHQSDLRNPSITLVPAFPVAPVITTRMRPGYPGGRPRKRRPPDREGVQRMDSWKKGQLEVRTAVGVAGPRVTLVGELDLSNVDIAEEALQLAEEVEGSPEIVLDLEQLTFIDSTGLAWMVAALRRHAVDGDRLRATGTTPAVERVFELTGMAPRLPLRDAPPAYVRRNTRISA
jgi:anti-sigma B factor antagonist